VPCVHVSGIGTEESRGTIKERRRTARGGRRDVGDTVLDGVHIGVHVGVGLGVVDVPVPEHALLGEHPLRQLDGKVLVS
jgi:hypothetical protein